MCNMSGASCVHRRSTLRPASPGARATTLPSQPRRRRLSGFILTRPTARWCWRWTRSRRSRRWSGRRGYLKLPNGRALTGQSHDYKRHGTTTLFAALNVASGEIHAKHYSRRRRIEFLDFMNSVTAAFPGRKLHVILDNLNTHKKNEHWLKAHPNVQFHFTPTSASWLNQVEVWFSILQGQSLSGASFTSLKQLQDHIDAYVNAYNDRAEPFVWTKKKVRQRRFKGRRITQL